MLAWKVPDNLPPISTRNWVHRIAETNLFPLADTEERTFHLSINHLAFSFFSVPDIEVVVIYLRSVSTPYETELQQEKPKLKP